MPEVKEPDLALAGLALLIIFGLLIWFDKPVESARPFDPYAQHQDLQVTGYSYESWLWQDPFGFDSISQKKESEFYSVNQKKEFAFYFSNQKKELEGQCEYQLNNLIKHIKEKSAEDTVKILAPLLKVRADTVDIENKELRTRDRYAVIAGLMESGYRPQEPEHLHFCSTQGNKEYDVRWEHFRYEPEYRPDKDEPDNKLNRKLNNKPDIIVAWMNSEIFTEDARFQRMSASLFKSGEISKVNFSVYDLNNILDQKRHKEVKDSIKKKNYNNVDFIESVLDDKALIKKLTRELELRNITEPSEVMIITEQDSENVRGFARAFRESLRNSLCDKPITNAQSSTCEIKNVFYLKGLDAYQQVLHKQDKNGSEADKPTARLSAIDLDTPPPPPIGPSQFDYFHRLAQQINDVHKEINLDKRDSGVKAVGIFGSDFYDKLLILEALRAEMPNMLVFTTGLDAQMLHPPHWLSTRNLVVASHFDLRLKDKNEVEDEDKERYRDASVFVGIEEYQKQFPPFRDSQQTSIFFRTIGIARGDIENSEIISPRIFEVGRNGFVRLPQGKNEDLNNHPLENREEIRLRLGMLGAVMVFLIFFHWRVLPRFGEWTQYLLLSPLVIFATTALLGVDETGEVLSFTEGVSLWPSIFLQLVAISLAWQLMKRTTRDLEQNFLDLNEQYFQIGLREVRPASPILLQFALIILAITILFLYAYNEVAPSKLHIFLCLSLLVLLECTCIPIIQSVSANFRFRFLRNWMVEDNCRSYIDYGSHTDYEACLWREYYNEGQYDRRVSRVVAIWPLFAIIETILIYLVPPWPSPCRGPTCGWFAWTWVICFSVSMNFLFFILDAVWLDLSWIYKLRKEHPLLARMGAEHLHAFNNTATNYPLQALERIVAMVAERTSVVDKLIYYPMLCIMLMFFSRITYFDNQDFPLSKGITFVGGISLLFFSGFMLRSEAEKLKHSVIKSAENLGRSNICIQPEVDAAVKRIKAICEGAFQPMFEQPVLRALLIILASIGLFAGEYLKLFE